MFGHSFKNPQGSGAFSGLAAPGIDLKNSGIYERKIWILITTKARSPLTSISQRGHHGRFDRAIFELGFERRRRL